MLVDELEEKKEAGKEERKWGLPGGEKSKQLCGEEDITKNRVVLACSCGFSAYFISSFDHGPSCSSLNLGMAL